MISVASLENSRRLFEVSEWKDTTFTYVKWLSENEWELSIDATHYTVSDWSPAYDLSFLLDKLNGWDVRLFYSNQWRRWNCWVDDIGISDENPCDSACLLCIKLFETNILKKGVD